MVSARPRDRILTTATELFRSEGIGVVGVNRIIGQADVAPMTLYRQFGGKDELEAWFASDGFRGSFVTNAATELRGEPDHPAQAKIVQHRQALRQLLEDLAKSAGAHDPAALAAQLQVLVDGAISAAAVDRDPAAASGARTLAKAAITAASSS